MEQTRSITMTAEIDTNKRTLTRRFDREDYESVTDMAGAAGRWLTETLETL